MTSVTPQVALERRLDNFATFLLESWPTGIDFSHVEVDSLALALSVLAIRSAGQQSLFYPKDKSSKMISRLFPCGPRGELLEVISAEVYTFDVLQAIATGLPGQADKVKAMYSSMSEYCSRMYGRV